MKLTFKNNSGDESEIINIKGKCTISDYDPRNNSPEDNNLTVKANGKKSSIMTGTEQQQDSQTVNLDANKYSIFTAIASADGNKDTLTQEDLARAKEAYNNKDELWDELSEHGVTEIKYDSHAGVATIVIGDKEILRIDFKTWRERLGLMPDSSKAAVSEEIKDKPTDEIEKPEEPAKTELLKPEIEFYNNAMNRVVAEMNEGQTQKITKKQLDTKISEIARNIPCSELLVKYIMSSESFIRNAKKNKGTNGVVTVGFGHTVNAASNSNFGVGFRISNEKAFQWLEQDIKDVVKIIHENYLPDINWEEVPQSIQDAIIDLVFNRGEVIIKSKNIGKILSDAAESGSYTDAAIKVSQIHSEIPDIKAGLMRRSCYRYFLAIESLPAKERLSSMKSFSEGNNSYYAETLRISSKSNAALLREDWLEVQHTAEKELGLYEEPPGIKYIVQPKDNLSKIAKKHNTTINTLRQFNNLTSDDLVPGQRLRIPEPEQNKEHV